MPWALSEPAIEDLTRDASKFLSFELDDLYAALGCQLLASGATTRVAHAARGLSVVFLHCCAVLSEKPVTYLAKLTIQAVRPQKYRYLQVRETEIFVAQSLLFYGI